MRVFIPKEHRVAATPETVKALKQLGLEVTVANGAGDAAFFPDEEYRKAGAALGKAKADIILAVHPPKSPDNRAVIISLLPDTSMLKGYQKKRITFLSMSHMPRITRAQKMDALTSQSNIAGYKAAIMAAFHLQKMFPLMMTAAGTIRPASVLVMGAGVAGLQAIATAKRLGAAVEASDIRPAVKEQVESLGAAFIEVTEDAEEVSGYAKEASREFARRQEEEINKRLKNVDVVITTALIPGKKAPTLLTERQVKRMRPGAVIIDLAAEAGGNCALTKLNKVIRRYGVTIDGTADIPGTVATHASEMYAKNALALLSLIIKDGKIAIDADEEIISHCLVMRDGKMVKRRD